MKNLLMTFIVCALLTAFTMPVAGQGQPKGAGGPPDRPGITWPPPHKFGDTEVTLGGEVNFRTIRINQEHHWRRVGTPPALTDFGSDDDLIWGINESPTRLNATFKRNNLTGFIDVNYDDDGFQIRHFFGEWNFGQGYLGIGKSNTPTSGGAVGRPHGRGFNSPGNYGASPGSKRKEMIRARFPFSVGEFMIAGIKPDYEASGSTPNDDVTFPPVGQIPDADNDIPLIEASLQLKFNPFLFHLSGGYVQFDEVDEAVGMSDKEYDLDAYLAQFMTSFRIGSFGLRGQVWTSQNPKQYGLETGTGLRLNANYDAGTDKIYEVDAYGWAIRAKYGINRVVSLEAGYHCENAERNDPGSMTQKSEAYEYFFKVPFRVTKGVTITPIIGLTHIDTTTNNVKYEYEENTYFGLNYRYVF